MFSAMRLSRWLPSPPNLFGGVGVGGEGEIHATGALHCAAGDIADGASYFSRLTRRMGRMVPPMFGRMVPPMFRGGQHPPGKYHPFFTHPRWPSVADSFYAKGRPAFFLTEWVSPCVDTGRRPCGERISGNPR